MSAIQVRGYMIGTALKYIDSGLPPAERARAVEMLGASTFETWKNRAAIEWCPVSELSQVFTTVGRLEETDDKALTRMVSLGKFISNEASNTFLRLFMRLMTPERFAGRLPTLFQRDVSGGPHLTIDRLKSDEMVATFRNVKDFNHVASVGIGWIAFALERMNKTVTGREIEGWSLQDPGPETATVTVRWRN